MDVGEGVEDVGEVLDGEVLWVVFVVVDGLVDEVGYVVVVGGDWFVVYFGRVLLDGGCCWVGEDGFGEENGGV